MTSLRELKEAALLHVLIGLFLFGRPARKDELHRKTGWSDEAVQDALDVLAGPEMNLVLCLPSGRHPLWDLTAAARQMLLPVMVTPLPAESDGGGSGLIDPSVLENQLTTTTTGLTPPPAESNDHKAELSTAFPHLVGYLAELGCSLGKARVAVSAALSRGETPRDLAQKIVDARRYVERPGGWRPRQPVGFWIAACLADGRAIPAAPRSGDDLSGYDAYQLLLDEALADDTPSCTQGGGDAEGAKGNEHDE